MDELFSCRNCIHNSAQTLVIGRGIGFCLIHKSILRNSNRTTCKYLSRKDLPSFVVDEGVKEHAYEFAMFSSIVDMSTNSPVERTYYSEKRAWLNHSFDALTQNLAHSYRVKPTWIFVQSLAGGSDGRRALAHSSLVRRYMANCRTWRSSYRFVLALVQELPRTPQFEADDLVPEAGQDALQDALWDVFFTRISGIQEYGFHAGLEELMWVTDHLNGALIQFDWEGLKKDLQNKSSQWTDLIIQHAQSEHVFFPDHAYTSDDDEDDLEPAP
jgi:hypothetical protein